jgi:hypothetical protein
MHSTHMSYTDRNSDAEKRLQSAVVGDTQDLLMVDNAAQRYVVRKILILI